MPFWLSVVVAAAGVIIRRTLEETPEFEREVATDTVAKMPLAVLFREQWRDVLRVVVAAVIASVSTIFTVHALSYAVNTMGLERTPMLWVGVLANIAALISIPLWGRLSDRVGRKPVLIGGSLGSAVLMLGYLWSIYTGDFLLIFAVGIALFGIVYSAVNAVWPSFYGEMFTTRVRLSGMAIGTQIGFAIAGFGPTVATAVAGTGPESWLGVSIITAVLCLVNVAAVATGRETYRVPTARLGLPPEVAAGRRDFSRRPGPSAGTP